MDTFETAYARALQSGDKELVEVVRKYPTEYMAVCNKLLADGDEALALRHFEIALGASANPACRAIILNDIGRIHANAGYTRKSLGFFNKANQLHPNQPGILSNLGLTNRWAGRYKEAESYLKQALRLNPWEHNAALESAFLALIQGDYARGFELYEARWRMPGGQLKKLECDKPEWDLTNGKNVFIYGEQGSGDIFLMLRYAKLIRALGVRQTWVVHKAMKPLVDLVADIDCVVSDGSPTPDFDCHFPAASLPRLFKTTLDAVPDGKLFDNIPPHDFGEGLHVGIVWRGNKTQINDRIRSTQLKEWLPVLNVPGVKFHSLQVDGADEGLLYPQLNQMPLPKDWLETAQRVAGLDLIISVDTSMVHLCGSMGKPVWCALHCRPYFVFPAVRDNCPWYSSVRLFKQKTEHEWKPVFDEIANELRKLNDKSTSNQNTV